MKTRRVLSLFSGAGGLDYGFEAAGFETGVAVELNHDCCETLRANRPWPVIERDIFQVSTAELLDAATLKPGDADVLIGGPPCQPFSKAGYWKRGDALRLDDPRANTLAAFLRVLEEAQPRAFLLENVEGLAYEGKDEGLRLLLSAIEDINRRTGTRYRPSFQVLNAADYGVPQIRQRAFLIGGRDGASFRFPVPSFRAREETDESSFDLMRLPFHRTAWDAIADVEPEGNEELAVRGKWAELLPSIPEGQNYLWHTDRMGGEPLFGWRRRFWSFLLKLAKSKPSWTIQAQPGPAVGPFHWENRRLSARELCRIQTFPDNVQISGGRTSVQKQLGNAVPSLLGEVLARSIATQLLGVPVFSSEPKLLPPDRGEPPPAEATKRVPRKFLSLAGDHSPHPGTGRGASKQRPSAA